MRRSQTIEKTRSALLKADYRLSFLTRVIAFYRAYVDFLMASGQTDRALEIADSSRGRVLAERLGVAAPTRGAAAAFRQRAGRAIRCSCSIGSRPNRSLAWVISAQRHPQLSAARRADEIEPLVEQYHAQLQNTTSDPLATADGAGDRLYARLVAPLAGALPRNAKLVIVPDGALHRLNFETLPVRSGASGALLDRRCHHPDRAVAVDDDRRAAAELQRRGSCCSSATRRRALRIFPR